jgi:mannose-1-phosphate guanylyltransferase
MEAYVKLHNVSFPGLTLHLDSLRIHSPSELAGGENIRGNVLVHEEAKIGTGCVIGPDVSIGKGCVIGDGVRLSNCVVMRGVQIKDHSKVDKCIVGWESVVGAWSRLESHCVLGEDVQVKVSQRTRGHTCLGWWFACHSTELIYFN